MLNLAFLTLVLYVFGISFPYISNAQRCKVLGLKIHSSIKKLEKVLYDSVPPVNQQKFLSILIHALPRNGKIKTKKK